MNVFQKSRIASKRSLNFLHTPYHKVLIFGDSKHVISKLINGYPSGAINCCRLYNKVKPLMHHSFEPLHILRINNSAADAMANIRASLPQGVYKQDGDPPSHKFIP